MVNLSATAPPCDEEDSITYYADSDGDGFGDLAVTLDSCTVPNGYVMDNTDCNDDDPLSYPGNVEVCDGIDNDCDGDIDEGLDCSQECPDVLSNEDVSLLLPSGNGVGGIDSVFGTDVEVNGSPCGIGVSNVDPDQPWGRYHIGITLSDYGIQAGDDILIGVDGRDGSGSARFEINVDNTPNAALGTNNFGSDWSRYETTVTVPSGISSLDLWFFSNYGENTPGTTYYDNLRVVNLSSNSVVSLVARTPQPLYDFNGTNDIILSPNPVSDFLNIRVSDDFIVETIRIYDSLGRLLQSLGSFQDGITGEFNIDLSNYLAGVYYISVEDYKGQILQKQVLVK